MRRTRDASRPARRLVGARRDRHVRRGVVAGGAAWLPPPTTATCRPRRRARRAVGPGAAARGQHAARPRTSSRELWGSVFGRVDDGRWRGKSWRPDWGHDLPLTPPPPTSRRATTPTRRSPRRRKRTTSRRDLARNDALRARSRRRSASSTRRRSTRRCEDDPDETLALLADLTGATDPKLRELARRLAGAAVPRPRPARPGAPARRRHACATQPYRPDGGDLDVDASLDAIVDGAASASGGRSRRPAGPRLGEARHGAVPARRPQRLDGRQAAGHRGGRRGGGGVAGARRLQRAGVRQGRRRRQDAGRRRSRASRWSTTCSRCAASAPPTSPARCGPPASQLGRGRGPAAR